MAVGYRAFDPVEGTASACADKLVYPSAFVTEHSTRVRVLQVSLCRSGPLTILCYRAFDPVEGTARRWKYRRQEGKWRYRAFDPVEGTASSCSQHPPGKS